MLLIEDDADIREGLADILLIAGFEVVEAGNGLEGLALARQVRPDLVLCDIMMPEMDGYGVLEVLRQDEELLLTPFMFLTALASPKRQRQGMSLGADDYLIKPISQGDLLHAIETRLSRQQVINQQINTSLDQVRGNIATALPHELRTPLSGILGLADILIEEHETLSPQEVLDLAKDIQTCSKRLFRLVQNFLLYTELEVTRNWEQNHETTITQDVVEIAQAKAEVWRRTADLQLEIAEAEVPIASRWLRKIVDELVDNAFRYSVIGSAVTVEAHPQGAEWRLTIGNHGRGMTPEQVAKIAAYTQFERHYYEQQGVGLGLYLSRRLVELHRGSFEIKSLPHRHTRVIVTLPYPPEESDP
ncbi:MAG: hybrid sensor histidine kinase/response regulator [Oscillatoriales cyanobacterium SM2_2_1]|nr:hybrid sensor histidine kinase/response regulator [Oscillatoriales cyanobacterium SM2_2_1]